MSNLEQNIKAINYTSREFNSIKQDLIDYTKRYYPESFRDFSEASFGSLMLDAVSYIGDILSFYIDYQANESFLDTATEFNNVIRLGKQLGHKESFFSAATGLVTFYLLVPAKANGIGINEDYIPFLRNNGTELVSATGAPFFLMDSVNFAAPNNEVVVAKVNDTTGAPTHYAIQALARVGSGELARETFAVGESSRFLEIFLSGKDITNIISVTDNLGHRWYEVDYLSQDVIYIPVTNTSDDNTLAKSVLRPYKAPRRFISERVGTDLKLVFGNGSDSELTERTMVDPSEVIMKTHGRDYVTESSFDPNKLLLSDKFGVAPENLTFTVVYRTNRISNVNTASRTLRNVTSRNFEFPSITEGKLLNRNTINDVISSLQVNNPEPIFGDASIPSVTELKHKIKHNYATQNRAVTTQDYKSVVYSMSGEFGTIKRCAILQDKDSFKRNLNIYVVSEDHQGKLIETSSTIKQNLKTWLNQYKMINDTIDILNARIVNLGIEFVILSNSPTDKFSVLQQAAGALQQHYSRVYHDIGQSFSITSIYKVLNAVPGVADTTKVKVSVRNGNNYSDTFLHVNHSLSSDGRKLIAPDNVIFEVKFPNLDIRGTVK